MKIAVGITGASGAIYARQLLQSLQRMSHQVSSVSVVFSPTAKEVWRYELAEESSSYGFAEYLHNDYYAPFASGSSSYDALVVCPCSMGTLGRIAHGVSDSLIIRAADVMLKERKKLVLVTREMPLNLVHIKNMELLTLAGGIICPASPSFYSLPTNVEQVTQTVVDRVLMLLGLETQSFQWGV